MREACAAWTYTSTQAPHSAETPRRPRSLVFFSSDLFFQGSVFPAPAASGCADDSRLHTSILSSASHERANTYADAVGQDCEAVLILQVWLAIAPIVQSAGWIDAGRLDECTPDIAMARRLY